jgi:hypothetical protein
MRERTPLCKWPCLDPSSRCSNRFHSYSVETEEEKKKNQIRIKHLYDFSIDVIVSEVLTLNLKLFLKSDNLRGDRGDVWFEARSVLGLLEEVLGVVVLHSLRVGVFGVSEVVRQCNRGVEGLLPPPERKPSLVQLLGVGLEQGLLCCFSDTEEESGSRGIVVQKALLQPVPISLFLYLYIYIYIYISPPLFIFYRDVEEEDKGKKRDFVLIDLRRLPRKTKKQEWR